MALVNPLVSDVASHGVSCIIPSLMTEDEDDQQPLSSSHGNQSMMISVDELLVLQESHCLTSANQGSHKSVFRVLH